MNRKGLSIRRCTQNLYIVVVIALSCGLPQGKLMSLRWENIDPSETHTADVVESMNQKNFCEQF